MQHVSTGPVAAFRFGSSGRPHQSEAKNQLLQANINQLRVDLDDPGLTAVGRVRLLEHRLEAIPNAVNHFTLGTENQTKTMHQDRLAICAEISDRILKYPELAPVVALQLGQLHPTVQASPGAAHLLEVCALLNRHATDYQFLLDQVDNRNLGNATRKFDATQFKANLRSFFDTDRYNDILTAKIKKITPDTNLLQLLNGVLDEVRRLPTYEGPSEAAFVTRVFALAVLEAGLIDVAALRTPPAAASARPQPALPAMPFPARVVAQPAAAAAAALPPAAETSFFGPPSQPPEAPPPRWAGFTPRTAVIGPGAPLGGSRPPAAPPAPSPQPAPAAAVPVTQIEEEALQSYLTMAMPVAGPDGFGNAAKAVSAESFRHQFNKRLEPILADRFAPVINEIPDITTSHDFNILLNALKRYLDPKYHSAFRAIFTLTWWSLGLIPKSPSARPAGAVVAQPAAAAAAALPPDAGSPLALPPAPPPQAQPPSPVVAALVPPVGPYVTAGIPAPGGVFPPSRTAQLPVGLPAVPPPPPPQLPFGYDPTPTTWIRLPIGGTVPPPPPPFPAAVPPPMYYPQPYAGGVAGGQPAPSPFSGPPKFFAASRHPLPPSALSPQYGQPVAPPASPFPPAPYAGTPGWPPSQA